MVAARIRYVLPVLIVRRIVAVLLSNVRVTTTYTIRVNEHLRVRVQCVGSKSKFWGRPPASPVLTPLVYEYHYFILAGQSRIVCS